MKFIPTFCRHDCALTHYQVSERGLVHMGVYRVLFGFRVRAGFTRDRWGFALDWCGGGDWSDVERLYSLCLAILEQRDETPDCFAGLPPVSRVKPFFKDPDFTNLVTALAGDNLKLLRLEHPDHFTALIKALKGNA